MNEPPQFKWYQLVEKSVDIQQGDFITKCPIFLPSHPTATTDNSVEGDMIEQNVVVLTQSCDLANKKIGHVLVCPYQTLDDYANINSTFKSNNMRENVRRGNVPYLHMLNICNLSELPEAGKYLIVNFRFIYTIDYQYLTEFAKGIKKRIRLLPPYREHLSQAFARFFMRVGLPVDIPKFN